MYKNLLKTLFAFLLLVSVTYAAPNSQSTRHLYPFTDSLYEIGTTTLSYLRGTFDELCLSGDTCLSAWSSGGGGLATSTPWTAGQLVRVVDNGTVDSVATSSLGLPLFSDLANYLSLSSWYATTTDALDEGSTNLYFTNARAQSALSGLYEVPLTFGDALTRTLNDVDFDGGATPSGDLGGTWASPSVTDDSHAHTGTTLSGIDISSDTNLSGDTEIVLTGDALSIGSAIARDSELHSAVTLAGENYLSLSSQQITAADISLTTNVTGTLGVGNGGTGITSLGTGVATALGVNVGTAGAFVTNGGALGTPSSGTLTNATGLPISTGVSGLGSNVATFLGTPSSANLDTAVTDDTGSGALVFATSPTITTSIIGTSNPTIGDTTLGNKFGNVYLTNSGDLFPDHDVYGLWDRKINYGFSPDEEWSQNADELTWTGYASYTGFVTPANITTTLSAYSVAHNDGVKRAFRYRSAATSTQIYLRARATVSFLNGGGLMIDDGVDDGDGQGATNFYRVYIKQSALAGAYQVFEEYRTGGGAVTTNTGPTIPYGEFIGIGLRCLAGTLWTSYTCNPFTFSEAQSSVQFTGGSPAMSWTPVRVGLFAEFSATDFGRRAIWDWYDEAAI